MTSFTKKLLITTSIVAALGIGSAAFAHGPGQGQGRHGGGMPGMGMMQGMMFWFLDRDDDGFVDTAEIENFRTQMFERHDPNSDGVVTREEMQESHAAMRGGRHGRRHGGGGYGQRQGMGGQGHGMGGQGHGHDGQQQGGMGGQGHGHDGQQQGGMGGQGHGHDGQQQGGMFERLDTDENGEISLAEFLASEPRMFSQADADGDGRVSREEMDQMRDNRRAWHGNHRQWHQDNPRGRSE
ncbi:MAG: EF-hand domain-containing protein [Rhizobiales bacterium]|nr:EF-hand domain-containing protein [Hyphomicrobiales bacterium]